MGYTCFDCTAAFPSELTFACSTSSLQRLQLLRLILGGESDKSMGEMERAPGREFGAVPSLLPALLPWMSYSTLVVIVPSL